ncbi:MAG: VOC family protein [Caulobacterales bacterium]
MILGFHHAALSSPDLERLKRFYCDVIGFETVYEAEWDKGAELIDKMMGLKDVAAKVAILRTGNCFLEIFEFRSPETLPADFWRPVHNHGMSHICIAVDDAQAEYERMSKAGMVFHCPPVHVGMPVFGTYGRDPDGNVIEVLEVRDPSFPLHFSNRVMKDKS